MLIYLMPTAFYSAVGYNGSWELFALNYLLILVATFSIYEYGYIFNDTVTIHQEQQPAIRLYVYNTQHFYKWRPLIITSRFLYASIALCTLYYLNSFAASSIAISLVVMSTLFAIYNNWRSRYNVWIYPLLVCSRYVPFMLLGEQNWLLYALLFVSFPLLNALERFSMPKYRWPLMRRIIPNEETKTRFRVCYYLIALAIICLVLYLNGRSLILVIPICILTIYRLSLLFWLKRYTPQNYLNG